MDDIKIVVVDDSPFSIMLITDILTQAGYNVVGSAGSLEEVKTVVDDLRPDLVTMDMTLPGTDGLECTRAIHAIDPNIKVIVVSSMMDEEIVQQAKKNNVSGYIQKPVDSEELILMIKRTMSNEELYKELSQVYYSAFKEAFCDTFNKLTKTVPEFKEKTHTDDAHHSQGICVVIGIIGKYSGRMLFDVSAETADKIAECLLRRPAKNVDEMHLVMGEFSNIVSGTACSVINRKNKVYGLRVAPPTIFHGESINISKGHLDTTTSALADTAFGQFYVNIGFIRGASEWMSSL
ncbi:MAG: response regulator [Solirubrobacterales bacterium]